MVITEIKDYLSSNIFRPFLAYVDNESYLQVKNAVETLENIETIRISDLCKSADKKPDLDSLREKLREIDVDCNTNQCLLVGLGEYLALEGIDRAKKFLSELLTFNLGTAQVVCLIRGFKNELAEFLKSDIRMSRQISVDIEGNSSFSITISPIDLGMYKIVGLKGILSELENNACQEVFANSSLEFPKSIVNISYVKNYYDALVEKFHIKEEKTACNEKYWELLWNDFNQHHNFEGIFAKHNFTVELAEELYDRITIDNYENWLYFIYLKHNVKLITNTYLVYALERSKTPQVLKDNILRIICTIPHKDSKFDIFYAERKKLLKYFAPEEVAVFVAENRKDIEEGIYRLTDCTIVEKQEIIAYIGQHSIPKNLEQIYPDLALYLKLYSFTDSSLRSKLTTYFDEYKQLKITNNLTDDFLDVVNAYARSKEYNYLPSRDDLVLQSQDDGAFLCWIDALGVEYLSYIVELAKKKGLMCSVKIGRADLPTITPINRGFFDKWSEDRRRKVERLDELKHKEVGGYRYGPSNLYPIHLAEELEVIKSVINDAAVELSRSNCQKYVIASDHGASRLAVLAKKEEQYETDTKGEHSGRCCKTFDNYNLPYATEDRGFIVLADYGRFKGSRAANVEVHGGASLEEVVVPLITLSLKDNTVAFELVKDRVPADRKLGTNIVIFTKAFIQGDVYVEYAGEKISGKKLDDNHWEFNLAEVKRAGKYSVNVYIGENLVSGLEFQAVGKMGSSNSDFDDLF